MFPAILDRIRRCIYAYTLVTTAALLKSARNAARLSIRALAARADVAGSTISRIEAGAVSPTVETLERLLAACGKTLQLDTKRAHGLKLDALADAWETEPSGDTRPDWTVLRGFLDGLEQHPERAHTATVKPPKPSGSEVMDNILAAIAETVSDQAGERPPRWTRRVEPLNQEWSSPGTPRMKEARKRATPNRFAKRGLIVDRESLWRDRARASA